MKKLKGFPTELMERLELPPELSGGVKITMWRNGRLFVEGICGLLDFTDDCICLAVREGKITARGTQLNIRAMNGAEAIIEGSIATVEWG